MNKVTTLGTLHEIFLDNPNYGLRDFLSALEQFKPDVIFCEVRPENPSVAEAIIEGGTELSLVYAFASVHNIQIIPTDWFDEEFFKLMQKEAAMRLQDFLKEIWPTFLDYRASFYSASLLALNSEKTQKFVREFEQMKENVGLIASKIRNEKILQNIKKELFKFTAKNILVIYGMDHKYFIDDGLAMNNHQKVLQVSEWFDPQQALHFEFNVEIKRCALSNLKAAEDMLTKRLSDHDYPPLWEPTLKEKLKQIAKWVVTIKAI